MINTFLCTVSLVNTSWRTQHCQGLLLLYIIISYSYYRRLPALGTPVGKKSANSWASHLASNNETTFKHIYIYTI